MKTMNLRDANQQFSKLVREVQETGEPVTILRDGKPAVKIEAIVTMPKARTPEQEAALARLLDPKYHFKSPDGWRFNREALWDDIVSRHAVVRTMPNQPATPKRSRKRG